MVHLYRPLSWQESLGYKVSLTLRNGKPRCRASVPEPRVGSHQCNKPGVVEVDGAWLCKVHDPKAQAERQRVQSEKWEAESRKRRLEYRGPLFARALQQIADGHNDPRELARQALGDLYAPSTGSAPDDRAARVDEGPASTEHNPTPLDGPERLPK